MNGQRARLDHLDALRGLAALLVLAGHARAFTFASYASLNDTGIGTKIFYALTSLGHEAVIVFFALSGFLVGGAALEAMLSARFSWPHFLLRRTTRLSIVAIPALIATAALDSLGLALTGGAGYDGALYDIYVSGPAANPPLDLTLSTFVGNLAFLQAIRLPIFGSNGPMWSLAYEFWYYILFPLVASLALVAYRRRGTAIALAIVGGIVWLLPGPVLAMGSIWVAGAAAAWASGQARCATAFRHLAARIALPGAAAAILAADKLSAFGDDGDLALGLGVALALPVLAHLPSFGTLYRGGARAIAEISYTLYLTHFPLLSLIVFAGVAPQRFAPGFEGAALFAALAAASIAWATGFWWCFERNTDRVHATLARRLPKTRRVIFPSGEA